MPTAILIDGAYFIKRFRALEPHNAYNPERVADCVHRWAVAHLSSASTNGNVGTVRRQNRRELYCIFFYDCPPLEKNYTTP